MKILVAALAFSMTAFAGERTGYISDTQCANDHAKADKAAEWIHPKVFETCAVQCVKDGSAAIFLTEDNKVVKIDPASMSKVMPHLGHKVSVTGKIEGDTLKVESINGLKW